VGVWTGWAFPDMGGLGVQASGAPKGSGTFSLRENEPDPNAPEPFQRSGNDRACSMGRGSDFALHIAALSRALGRKIAAGNGEVKYHARPE
jgi:hypothetical protein